MKRQKLLRKSFSFITALACALSYMPVTVNADEGDPVSTSDVTVYYVNEQGEEDLISNDSYFALDEVTVSLSEVTNFMENNGKAA